MTPRRQSRVALDPPPRETQRQRRSCSRALRSVSARSARALVKAVQKAEQLIAQRCRLQTPLVALPPPSYSPHTGVDESRLAFLLTHEHGCVSGTLTCSANMYNPRPTRSTVAEAPRRGFWLRCALAARRGAVLLAVLLRGFRRRTLGGILHCPVAQQPRYLFSSGEHNMLLFQWLWQPMCASFSPRTTTKAAVPMRRPQTMH